MELCQIISVDEYPSDYHSFVVLGYDVAIKDSLISAALQSLPAHKRDVVLLSYFLDMPDTEIARRMQLVNSTIHYHRTSSLKLLKQFIEKERLHGE